MKRPIFIIAIGFIIGIIGGLLYNKVPFLFCILICLNIIIKLLKIKKSNCIFRFFNVIKNSHIILVLLITSLISSCYVLYLEKQYNWIYNNFEANNIIATVISNYKANDYKNVYKIKIKNNKKNIYFLLKVPKTIKLDCGDKIKFNGEYTVPEESRNYGGFNYKRYLKTQKLYGIIEVENVEILQHNNISKIRIYSNIVKNKIINNTNHMLPKETKELFLGILIGYDDNLQESLEESFNKSSLSHLLAVSGMHIAYIIIGLNHILTKLGLTKKMRNIFIILFLIFFMYITDFSSSVVRASIMGIISLLPTLIYRKSDIKTNISISILIILLNNPYKILDIGLILSYLATIGIIFYTKLNLIKEIKEENILINIIRYIKENVLISLFANIFVMPIIIYNFNTLSLTFYISNLVASLIMGPIMIGGFLIIIGSFINIKIASVISILYNILLKILICTTNVVSVFPLSQILVPTPQIIWIIVYYIILLFACIFIILKKTYPNRFLFKKIYKYFLKFLEKIKKYSNLILILSLIIIILMAFSLKTPFQNLKIYFIDVGQGDSTLIVTPENKKILIDGGGSESDSFDVGKNTLLPYLLDRKIVSLDYVFISHFDSDHCKRIILYYGKNKYKTCNNRKTI